MLKIVFSVVLFIGFSVCHASWTCSSFLINKDGYIATAAHCVAQDNGTRAKLIRVVYQGQLEKATIIAVNLDEDVAIIKIDKTNTPHGSLALWADSGDKVYNLGYPIPNMRGRDLKISGGTIYKRYPLGAYLTSAGACSGNSGGPTVNELGNIVGILVAGLGEDPCYPTTYVVNINYLIRMAVENDVHITINDNTEIVPVAKKDLLIRYIDKVLFLIGE